MVNKLISFRVNNCNFILWADKKWNLRAWLLSKPCKKKYHWSWGFIGGNFGAVAWLLLSLSLPSGLIPWEGFWEENFYWIFFSEGHLEVYQVPYASWCLFGYCLLRNKYLMTCVLPLIMQRKETVWRFQVEAHVAYTCKQILGLCQIVCTGTNMQHLCLIIAVTVNKACFRTLHPPVNYSWSKIPLFFVV